MKVWGYLERAQIEVLSADPAATLVGRLYWNTTSGRPKIGNGSAFKDLLTNDQNCIFGTSATSAFNVRLNRYASGSLQLLLGDDTTAEGAASVNPWAHFQAKLGGSVLDTYFEYYDQGSSPSTPSAGVQRVYSKSDGLYIKNSSGTETNLSAQSAQPRQNYLINGNFDFWQVMEGTTLTVANGATTYGPDQWYVKNGMGASCVLSMVRTTAANDGGKYGFQVSVTTPAAVGSNSGFQIFQPLENIDTRDLYNQQVSISVKIKAVGNVIQAGLQLYYAASEVKLTTAIGSNNLTTITSGAWTTVTASALSVGTAMGVGGILGLCISATAVSGGGNVSDNGNGLIIEQAILNLGTTPATFNRRGRTIAEELMGCQRFYEKSYALGTAPGNAAAGGGIQGTLQATATYAINHAVTYRTRKRTAATLIAYSIRVANTPDKVSINNASDSTATYAVADEIGVVVSVASAAHTAGDFYNFQWIADSRI